MKVFRCDRCGKDLSTELNDPQPCRYCGSRRWAKANLLRWSDTLRIFWMTRGELLAPPEGSILETLLKKVMTDTKEAGRLGTG